MRPGAPASASEAAGGAGAGVEGGGGGGGDERRLRGVGLERDGDAVERAEEGLGAGSAEEGDLDALHGVVAEELDFGGGVEPVGGVAVLRRRRRARLLAVDQRTGAAMRQVVMGRKSVVAWRL